MTDAEKERILERTLAMSEEELTVAALATPTEILIAALSEQTRDMKDRILSTADALQGRSVSGAQRELSVIGGV